MRYCATCDEPRVMGQEGDEAVCPACGGREVARRMPFFVVTGASAVGKSTVQVPLAVALADQAAVFDSDSLIDAFGRVSGGGPTDWDALLEAWVEVAHALAQQGRATVLLCSFEPRRIERVPNRAALGPVHHLLLDCADEVRQERLDARPPWRDHDDEGQTAWSRRLREDVDDQIRTDLLTPDDTVAAAAAWVRAHLADDLGPTDR
jgi:hypothetical protein